MSDIKGTLFYSQIRDKLSNNIVDILNDKNITVNNVSSILIENMKIVEQYRSLSGCDKKELIIEGFYDYIDNNIITETEAIKSKIIIKNLIPNLIDIIIKIDKKEIKIKNKYKKKLFCF